jgi:hypothetical protein
MSQPVSGKSEVTCMEIGNLMGALAGGFCDRVTVTAFGDNVVPVQFSKHKSVFDNMQAINDANSGHSTQGWKVPAFLKENQMDVERVIIFTDLQLYEGRGSYNYLGPCIISRPGNQPQTRSLAGGITEYRRSVNHPVRLYIFDLTGYGTLQTPQDDKHTYNIGGWSDKVFEWMNYAEQDPSIIIDTIRKYQYERTQRRNGGGGA